MTGLIKEQTSTFEQADIDNNRTMAGHAYFIFFLPLPAHIQTYNN